MDATDVSEQCDAIPDEVASAVVVGRQALRTVLAGFLGGGADTCFWRTFPGLGRP